jgi:hypothetical protein
MLVAPLLDPLHAGQNKPLSPYASIQQNSSFGGFLQGNKRDRYGRL